jgi:release factor glutamine methyltransferase
MVPADKLVKNILPEFRQKLGGLYPDREIRQFVYILFEEYLGWHKTRVHLSPDEGIPEPVMASFNLALLDLLAGKPIQYVIRKCWFNGTLLEVDAGVLVPRPETEELCAIIKADYRGTAEHGISILDIGTGSGCIAIDLKKYFPGSKVTAIDVSQGALEIAQRNAWSSHAEISFVHANILDPGEWADLGKFNVIVSNPPYVPDSEKKQMHRNVTEFEPAQALFVRDDDPLEFYRAISGFAVAHLIPPASLYFEINEHFGREVGYLVSSLGYQSIRIMQDLHGKDRFVSAVFP